MVEARRMSMDSVCEVPHCPECSVVNVGECLPHKLIDANGAIAARKMSCSRKGRQGFWRKTRAASCFQ